MDMFEKATKVAKDVSGNVINQAKNIGSSIYSTTKEQGELAGLNVQKSLIEKRLESSYAIIGKRYVEYATKCEADVAFNIDDIMETINPDLEKIAELKEEIANKEAEIKQSNNEKAKKKAEEEFEAEKKKLDKALELDVINQDEYDAKLLVAKKKLDNFETLRKVKLQWEMDIITKEEYEEKVNNILK